MEIINLFIPIDVFYSIYLKLDIKNAYQLSQTCKLCYNIYTNNNQIWEKHLSDLINIDDKELIWKNDCKQTFKKCFEINKIKSFYKMDDNIITINNKTKLYLNSNWIISIPSEIGQLINLQEIYLYNNQITSIPSEILQLINLQELCLSNNQITSTSSEIKNMIDNGIIRI